MWNAIENNPKCDSWPHLPLFIYNIGQFHFKAKKKIEPKDRVKHSQKDELGYSQNLALQNGVGHTLSASREQYVNNLWYKNWM